jgi:pyruvate kinase
MTLYREVFPLLMKDTHQDRDIMRYDAEQRLIEAGVVKKGDLIVLCYGDEMGLTGGTNTLTIVRVGDQTPPEL